MTPSVFAHGHLRLYLLSLLAARPMHGYELIQALTDRFGGTYVPSAGTIYPRLAKLEEDGLGGIEDELSDSVRRLANEVRTSVTDAMKTLRADLVAAARDARAEARAEVPRDHVPPADGLQGEPRADDARVQARIALRVAEAAINDFRQQLRTDLRTEVANGRLEPSVVGLLTSRLTELRREITAALRA